jgi:Gpi18-like mannosyltransferase
MICGPLVSDAVSSFVFFMKLPNIVAFFASALVLYHGLKRKCAKHYAISVANNYLMCIPLLCVAAVWGQWEALLAFFVIVTLMAAINDQPFTMGAAAALALSLKVTAIVFAPTILVYVLRKSGTRGVFKALIAFLLATLLLCVPIVLHGAGRELYDSYTVVFNKGVTLSNHAENLWMFLREISRFMPGCHLGNGTDVLIAGLISPRNLGLLLLFIYTLATLIVLWRRPTVYVFALGTAMVGLAFYILSTQIHNRWGLPALALLSILSPGNFRLTYFVFCVTMFLEIAIGFYDWVYLNHISNPPRWIPSCLAVTNLLLSFIQCVIFTWASIAFFKIATSRTISESEYLGLREPTS